jgi:molecular chaperone DnaK (HSP70)
VLAGVACLAAVAVGSFGLTTEATLGIDLGTTFSVAATCERGVVTVVRVPGGSGTHAQTMPSVVYFPERAREAAVVGADAARRRDTHPTRVVYDAKRLIGRRVDDPAVAEESKHLPFAVVADDGGFAAIQLGEADDHTPAGRHFAKPSSIAPEAVGAAILARLKAAAETAGDGGARSFAKRLLGFRFRTVTVSVPVNFSSEQKAATLRAARTAGFAVARLLEEPVAAAVAHDALRKERDENAAEKKKRTERDDGGALVLVYDLGGGTLDVAVLRSEPSSGTFLVMGSAGDDRLGGEDFDRALLEWAREKLSALPEPIFFPDALDGGRDERVRGDAPAAREEKDDSKDDSNDASNDGFDRNASFSRQTPTLTRAAFTSALSARWNSPRNA